MITNQKKLILIEIEIFLNHNKNLLVCLSVILSSEVLIISLCVAHSMLLVLTPDPSLETPSLANLRLLFIQPSDWPKARHVTQADPIRVLAVFHTRKLRGRCSLLIAQAASHVPVRHEVEIWDRWMERLCLKGLNP